MSERNSSQAKKTAKKAVKKAYKKNPKAFIIAVVAIVLVIAITVAVIYFAFPKTWDSIMSKLGGKDDKPALQLGEGELQVHYVDVGQGDCILILFPDGKEMLIDCGSSVDSNEIEQKAISYIDAHITDDQLDYLMVTHGDSDHTYFVNEVLDAFDVDKIYMPFILAEPSNEDKANAVNKLPKEKLDLFTDKDTLTSGVYADFFVAALSEPDAEIAFNIGEFSIETATYRFDFYCYAESEWESTNLNSNFSKNAISPIGILEYNGKRMVFTGDSNEVNEPKFIEQFGGTGIDCDVLKVAHHGSESSSTRDFLNFVNCEYAVICCGLGNNHGHPTQDALDRLKEDEMELYRTDLHGTVVLIVDGQGNISFTTEKTTTADIWQGAEKAD